MTAAVAAAAAVFAAFAPPAPAAVFESLDGTVRFDATAASVAVRTADGTPILGPYAPPAPFRLDGQYLDVTCRAGPGAVSARVDGVVSEPSRVFALAAASPAALAGLPRFDLPECRLTRGYVLSDATGPFPQTSLEQVGLVPAAPTPAVRFTRTWTGVADGARLTVSGTSLTVDARGATRFATWAEEVFGTGAFVAVCDVGGRRAVARFPRGIGPRHRATGVLRQAPSPPGARRGVCRLGHPFKLLNERAASVGGVVVRAALRPAG